MAVNRRTLILLRQLAIRVGGTTDDTVRAIAAAWLREWDRLTPAWRDAIAAVLDQYAATGVWPAPWRVARIEAVARAQQATERSLTTLMTEAAVTTAATAAVVSAATVAAEPPIIAAQLPPAGSAMTAAGVAAATAATVVAAALAARQQRITALHASAVTETLVAVRRVFVRPPARPDDLQHAAVELAGRARTGFDGGLTRAATVARVELVDTYRTAAEHIDRAHGTVVRGWCWISSLDRRCCPACWAMHGRWFPLGAPGPEGHPGCRCQRVPVLDDADLPSAAARFRRLPRRDQLAVMGPGRLALLRGHPTLWGSLAVRKANRGWRQSYAARPVGELERIAVLLRRDTETLAG